MSSLARFQGSDEALDLLLGSMRHIEPNPITGSSNVGGLPQEGKVVQVVVICTIAFVSSLLMERWSEQIQGEGRTYSIQAPSGSLAATAHDGRLHNSPLMSSLFV